MNLETCLTPNSIKEYFFERDTNYVSALTDMRQCWTSTDTLHNMLWNTSALLLRPDAIAGHQAASVLPVLRSLGFVPIAACPIRLTLAQTRELWRYQANVSTTERLRLLDLIMTSGQSLYILFRDTTVRETAPATVHLNYLKGTAIVKNRRRWHLRTIAGPLVANIVSYVHVSDDPADMVREMAVLFSPLQRLEIIKEAEQVIDKTDKVLSLLTQLQSNVPTNLLEGNSRLQLAKRPATTWGKNHILNTENLFLSETDTLIRWRYIVGHSKQCKVFIDGDTYVGANAIVPDDKELSLPLDSHLIFQELGPR